jgi:OOP family OmpA-OmpF porin
MHPSGRAQFSTHRARLATLLVLVAACAAASPSAAGICIGTPAQCEPAPQPASFDVSVEFDLDSAALSEAAIASLKQVAIALTDPRLSGAKFAIEGYTDASGTTLHNQDLAERRALSVASFLVSQGVAAERLIASGRGETDPRMPDPYDPANRRVEMRIIME